MISPQFQSAAKSQDTERIKIMMKNSLSTDLTFNQFQSMLDFAMENVPGLIDTHDEIEFEDKSMWNKQYANYLKEDLMDNFSAERIEHIKEVQQHVYADELKKQQQTQRNMSTSQQTTRSTGGTGENTYTQTNSDNFDLQQVITLIASSGVAVASILLGLLKGLSIVTVFTTAAIATVAVGGITYYIIKK